MTKYELLLLKLKNYSKTIKGNDQDLLRVMIANDIQDIIQSVENADLPDNSKAKKD